MGWVLVGYCGFCLSVVWVWVFGCVVLGSLTWFCMLCCFGSYLGFWFVGYRFGVTDGNGWDGLGVVFCFLDLDLVGFGFCRVGFVRWTWDSDCWVFVVLVGFGLLNLRVVYYAWLPVGFLRCATVWIWI